MSALSSLREDDGLNVLEVGELCLCSVPHLDRIDVAAHQILQVGGQGPAIRLKPASCWPSALRNVEDDAGESVFIDPHLLVIWYLAQLAVEIDGGMSERHDALSWTRTHDSTAELWSALT